MGVFEANYFRNYRKWEKVVWFEWESKYDIRLELLLFSLAGHILKPIPVDEMGPSIFIIPVGSPK